MIRRRSVIAAFLMATGALVAPGQNLVKQTYLIRVENTTADAVSDVVHNCVLVYPDGKYRMEHSVQHDTGKPDDQVYLGELPEDLMQQLKTVLDDPELLTVPKPARDRGVIQDVDSLFAMIPRQSALQSIGFWTTKDRKPYQASLKPLQAWMKDVIKHKVPQAKKEPANNCEPPELIYRTVSKDPDITFHPD